MVHKVLSAVLRRVGWYPAASPARRATKGDADNTHKLPFEEWQALNPGGTFKDYYVASVLDVLSGKKRHATLGPKVREGSLEQAAKAAQALIALGIAKSDVVVDYGCGTLRVGRTLIEYLEPSRFVGLDIDQRILDTGRALLPPDLAEEKTPILGVIGDDALAEVAAMRPRWIFSKGVIHHVPPDDLSEFFGNISRLTFPETEVLIWARFSYTTTHKAAKRTWFHSPEDIKALAHGFGLDGEVTMIDKSRVMRFRRSSKAA